MSGPIKDGGPAFPVGTQVSTHPEYGAYVHQSGPHEWQFGGLTVRDYFAAKAIGDLIIQGWDDQEIAIRAYKTADAMLAAREAKS